MTAWELDGNVPMSGGGEAGKGSGSNDRHSRARASAVHAGPEPVFSEIQVLIRQEVAHLRGEFEAQVLDLRQELLELRTCTTGCMPLVAALVAPVAAALATVLFVAHFMILRVYTRVPQCGIRKIVVNCIDFSCPSPESKNH